MDYRSSFLQTNLPIFIIILCFVSFYIFVQIMTKFKDSCCASCPCLLKYMSYICEFMDKRFKYVYLDMVMWISYIPFVYFAILQLKAFPFDTGVDALSTLLAMVIIAIYPIYPFFILRKLFDRSDDPNEDLSNYKAYTLKLPLDEEEEAKKGCCDDFQWCPVERSDIAMVEMSLSPYIGNVKRPVYNEDVPDYAEFRYCSVDHWRLIVIPITYLRKFAFCLIVAVTESPITTLSLVIGITLAFIIYLIVLKPKKTLWLICELVIEFVLLVFLIFMLVYVIIGGGKVTAMSIVTHAFGFVMANSAIIIAIVLNIISYYTVFCCLVDMVRYLKTKVEEEDMKDKKIGDLLNPGERISDFDPRDPKFQHIDFDEKEDFFIDPEVRNELPSELRDEIDAEFDEKLHNVFVDPAVRDDLPSEIRDQIDAEFDEKLHNIIPPKNNPHLDPNLDPI